MPTLADIPIGGAQYRQIDRLVQEINGLAEILTGTRRITIENTLQPEDQT